MTDLLLATFKRIMSMTDFQTSWIQLVFYTAYFCLALPAAWFIRRYSYKAGVLLGLGAYAVGALLFYPASIVMEFWFFLLALYILAGGLSILETSANPYIIAMGPAETGTRRLNIAQAFNPVGSIAGILIGKYAILGNLHEADAEDRMEMSEAALRSIQEAELSSVMSAYVGVAFVIVAVFILIALVKLPDMKESSDGGFVHEITELLKRKKYVLGVLAQTFYMGAQIGVWSFTIRYAMQNLGFNEADASNFYLASIVCFSLCRFAGTGLMFGFSPQKVLLAFAALSCVCCVMAIISGCGIVGTLSVVGISAFMSIMFPTIYGLACEGLGERTKMGASGMIMAIIGGAIFTAIQGRVSDAFGIKASFVIPLICLVVVFIYAASYNRLSEKK